MAADASFDVTSKIDRMELDNAINQAVREIETRFDFKNTGSKIELEGDKVLIEADTEERAKAALDVVKDKMIKRGVSLKHLDAFYPPAINLVPPKYRLHVLEQLRTYLPEMKEADQRRIIEQDFTEHLNTPQHQKNVRMLMALLKI